MLCVDWKVTGRRSREGSNLGRSLRPQQGLPYGPGSIEERWRIHFDRVDGNFGSLSMIIYGLCVSPVEAGLHTPHCALMESADWMAILFVSDLLYPCQLNWICTHSCQTVCYFICWPIYRQIAYGFINRQYFYDRSSFILPGREWSSPNNICNVPPWTTLKKETPKRKTVLIR